MERLVSLTSFPARIGGVKSTIDSVKRDGNVHVVLTLSDEEFPDHVIPDTGADEIIWVPKDIGPFKKVLYTMKKQNRPEKWSQDRLKYLFCKRTPVSAFQISAVLAV